MLTCGQQSDIVQSSVSIAYENIIATIIIIAMYVHGSLSFKLGIYLLAWALSQLYIRKYKISYARVRYD